MKKYDSILNRVKRYEEKCGIKYAVTDGKLYKTSAVLHLIVTVYLFGINSLFLISASMRDVAYLSEKNNTLFTVLLTAGTVISLVSSILLFTRLKTVGSIASVIPAPFYIYVFIAPCKPEVYLGGIFHLSSIYYWRHLLPSALILILGAILIIIDLRARHIVNRRYSEIVNNLYKTYNKPIEDENTFSDEEWDEFLKNYDPSAFKNI